MTETTHAREAIANADAFLSNVGLPSYSELLEALRRIDDYCDRYMPSARRGGAPIIGAASLVIRHDARMSAD